MSKVTDQVGTTSNSYRVLAKLAVGGMAEIFLVRSVTVTGAERYCVLKRMLPERAGDLPFVQMFLEEARLATLLQHPNIASAYDIGMLDDLYFYTMEYVHGETVRSLVQRAQELRRPLPLACALTIIAGAAAGLHHAHERNANDGRPLGVVHRDVSPSNLMVSYEGNSKLVDFGVAKASDRAFQTRSGTVKGKISYLSPEQCRGERVDRRSDLFSLGIMTWEILTGERLYRRATDFESMAAIVNEAPVRPSCWRAELPREIDAIVLRMLSKSVARRFQTAAEVVEAIENASIRGGTALSTAAVGRLMLDLFGRRAEPWRELELDRSSPGSMTLVSRPIPRQLASVLLHAEEHTTDDAVDGSASRPSSSTLDYAHGAVARAIGASPPVPLEPEVATLSVEVSDSDPSFTPSSISGPERKVPDGSTHVLQWEATTVPEGRCSAYLPVTSAPRMQTRMPRRAARFAAWLRAPRVARLAIAATGVAVFVAIAMAVGSSGRSEQLRADTRHGIAVHPVEPTPPVAHAEQGERPAGPGSGNDSGGIPIGRSPALTVAVAGPQGNGGATSGSSEPHTRSVSTEPVVSSAGAPSPAQRPPDPDGAAVPRGPRAPEMIAVAIDSEPSAAQVVVDGHVVGRTPFRGRLARRDREVRFVIRLAGYADRIVVTRAARPISQHVMLARSMTPLPPVRDRILNPF